LSKINIEISVMGIARDIKRMLSGYAGCHIIGLINLLHNYWK
jgi:hypothetical protein